MRKIGSVILLLLFFLAVNAEEKKSEITGQTIGFELRPSYIAPTNSFVRGVDGHRDMTTAVAPHLRYSFSFAPSTRYGSLYPGVYQGIGISYTAILPKPELGHPVTLYLFQGSRIASFSPRLSLDYELNFGVSAGWKKYDKESMSENTALGSTVNAYLNAGVMLTYKVSQQWKVYAGIEGTHFSDGNSKLPNPGVNFLGGRIGIAYTLGEASDMLSTVTDFSFEPGLGYDILVYGAPRQRVLYDSDGTPELVNATFGVGGVTFAPMYAFNPYFRAGASADFQYDTSVSLRRNLVPGASADQPLFFRQPFSERFSAGLSLHAELTMPIFSINLGVGRNIIAGSPDTKIFYQTLALKTYLFRNAFLNIGYQLRNFHQPNNLMLGVGYSFGAGR